MPDALRALLTSQGWAGSGGMARSAADIEALLDLPVPIESWGAFDQLFAWDERPQQAGSLFRLPTPLGLAVNSFFAEGGARCWIIRTGDPLPLLADADPDAASAAKRRLLAWPTFDPLKPPPATAPGDYAARAPLIPGLNGLGTPPDPADPRTWRGVGHIFGIDDAAMLLLPDLPELIAGSPAPLPPLAGPPPVPEQFKDCAPAVTGYVPEDRGVRLGYAAPRLDRAGYRAWAIAIKQVLDLLALPKGAAHRRDVMLLASLPLPSMAAGAVPLHSESWPLAFLEEADLPGPDATLFDEGRLGNDRLQLAYPWIETAASGPLPEGVEGAEGAFAGMIARTSLAIGAFRSAAGSATRSVLRTLPELGNADLERAGTRADWLGDRLSLIAARNDGFVLLSDATAADDRAWRIGGVSRLMGIILRAARTLGQTLIFEPSGQALWARARNELEAFLTRLWKLGALDGGSAEAAFQVRCDRGTMTQADIDAGRLIVRVGFTAAQPIQEITATLMLTGGVAPAQVPLPVEVAA